jgi:8-oxo-dGTP pyrophosphatase MutT (NUDIX family)
VTTEHRIRPIAIAIIKRGDEILVFEGYRPDIRQTYYRPLGGGIDFGEQSRDTLIREIREELGAEITPPRYLATLENIFVANATPGHEIVQVYHTEFADPTLYRHDELIGRENDGTPFRALWKALADFEEGQSVLYPNGLLQLLRSTK